MNNSTLDLSSLQQSLNPKKKVFKLADVKDKLTKIAFDVVRFSDGDVEGLWKVEKDDSGEYIVAMYEEDSPEDSLNKSANLSWNVSTDGDDCHIFYKNSPVGKFSFKELGICESDKEIVSKYLPMRLATNLSNLTISLLSQIDLNYLNQLTAKYPELTTFIK